MPLPQALEVGAQIADGLGAAHRQNVVHRDLKPGNVMLTKAGAKLLDFGLAKLQAHGEQAAALLASTPTERTPLTAEGQIAGTLPYMAPEQLEGKAADARTDLWALGAILYEMVTGKRAFDGTSAASLIGAILEREPPALATVQPLTPPAVDRVVHKCLAKDPDARWQAASDVADELRWIAESAGSQGAVTAGRLPRRVWLGRALWGLSLAGVALVGALLGGRFGVPGLQLPRGSATASVGHLAVMLPSDAPLWLDPAGLAPSLALSPDGSVIAYTCARGEGAQICLQRLDRDSVSPIAGTEGGRFPVFSPDGQAVLFCVANRYTFCDVGAPLKRLSVMDLRVDPAGTIPEAVATPMTLEWTADGNILLSGTGGIWTMPMSGGAATRLVRREDTPGDINYILGALLPQGKRIIFTAIRSEREQFVHDVRVRTLATGEQTVVVKNGSNARYLPTGHLLYREGPYWGRWVVAPFDPVSLDLGAPVPLGEPVRQHGGWAVLAHSRTGTLLYLPVEADRVLTWVDRQQRSVPALVERGPWQNPRLSPDGRRVAVEVEREQMNPGISIVDLDRGARTEIVRAGTRPLWTPDGRRIACGSIGGDRLSWQPADGSGTSEVLYVGGEEGAGGIYNNGSWSPNGQLLAYMQSVLDGPYPISTLSRVGSAWISRRFGSASLDGSGPRFSPDGRWIAYSTNEKGTYEVYVRAYPAADHLTPVSVGGGYDAVWSADGRELFYRNGDRFYAVSVTLTPTLSVTAPRLLFSGPYLDAGPTGNSYDVTRDGQRFLVVQVSEEERAPRRLAYVQNWVEELKAKVPRR